MQPIAPDSILRCLVICTLAFTVASTVTFAEPSAPTAPPPAAKKAPAKPAPRVSAKQHFTDRVKIFRDENKALKTSNNIVFVGDSITEGFNLTKSFPGHHVLNRGIGSDVIGNALPKDDNRGILHRLNESIYDCRPAEVFILIGINDLGMGHKPETIEAGYRELLSTIKSHSPDLPVHIQSVMPTRGNYAKHNANINDLNKRLQKLAKEFGYTYVDLHSKMIDDKAELKKELTREGLHLNPEGYKVWKAEIDKIMGW